LRASVFPILVVVAYRFEASGGKNRGTIQKAEESDWAIDDLYIRKKALMLRLTPLRENKYAKIPRRGPLPEDLRSAVKSAYLAITRGSPDASARE